ncbi:MAG: acylphosphatase [Sphingomicrobium sp.]|jgi:acylphosphatase
MAIIARHVSVTGRVQGVFFRAWTKEQAEKLGITGWVRNCPDGRVDAHVEGEKTAVDAIVQQLRRGPSAARVEDVRLWDADPCDFESFEVRH